MTTAPLPAGVDAYPLERSAHETRRLVLQHQIYGPLTRRLLLDAGVTAGMKVLDVGSGAGDVALVLADLVGPRGQVVGLDMDPDVLRVAAARAQSAGWDTISFRQAQLQGLDAARVLGDDFDAVVGRWILMYQPDPTDLLRRLRACLRPGGLAVFQESDLTDPFRTYPAGPLHQRLAELMSPSIAIPDREMGLKLYRTFVGAGFTRPHLRADTPAGGGPDWPGPAYIAASARSLLPHLERTQGLRLTDLDLDIDSLEQRLRDEAPDGTVQFLATVVGAWGRT